MEMNCAWTGVICVVVRPSTTRFRRAKVDAGNSDCVVRRQRPKHCADSFTSLSRSRRFLLMQQAAAVARGWSVVANRNASSSGSPASSPPIQPTDTHMWRTFVVYTREPAKSQFMRTEAGFHAARRKATCDEHVVMRSPVGCSSSREVGRQQTGSIT